MKRQILATTVIATLLTAFSCQKSIDNPGGNVPENPIPKNFDWKTVTETDCEIEVKGTASALKHIIKIYSNSLMTDESLIATGAVYAGETFSNKLVFPATVSTLYIAGIRPDGSRTVQEVSVGNGPLRLTLGETQTGMKARMAMRAAVPDAELPAEFDRVINDNGNINIEGYKNGEPHINAYKSYLLPAGRIYSGKMTFSSSNHAILYVAGTLDVGTITLDNTSIVVLNGGKLTLNGLSTGKTSSAPETLFFIEEGGQANITGTFNISVARKVVNAGTFNLSAPLDMNNAGSTFDNYGTISMPAGNAYTMHFSNGSRLNNYGTIQATNVQLSGASILNNAAEASLSCNNIKLGNTNTVLTNDGSVLCSDAIEMSGSTVNNNCRIVADAIRTGGGTIATASGTLTRCQVFAPTGTTRVNLQPDALFICSRINDIYGLSFNAPSGGEKAVVICKDVLPDLQWTSPIPFNGNIEVVYGNLSNTNKGQYPASKFINGAYIAQEQQTSISKTGCNDGEGNINNATDSDGDGIPDDLDEFPDDPQRAFITYFPSKEVWGTYAFEDLWPAPGDYDMNDLVLGFQLVWISNADNETVEMSFRSQLRAYGSGMDLAAAFQLDGIAPGQIESVTGNSITNDIFTVDNGMETGQQYAVIPIFDNYSKVVKSQQAGAFGNTRSDGGRFEGEVQNINVLFAQPVSMNSVNVSKVNTFITVKGKRGKEVHMPTYQPTSKAAEEVDGTNLSESDRYKTSDGMMWALMLPCKFDYPIEKKNISEIYNHFREWAVSGRTQAKDWYEDKPGYRNSDKIYK